MPTPQTESSWTSRCAASLERSRARREKARRERRRRLRARGGGASAVMVALAVGIVGAGAAVGHNSSNSTRSYVSYGQNLLAKGSRGPAVVQVQRALGLRGTGYFGPVTAAAVRRFQRQHGLLVDGIVGPQTRAALGLAAATGAGASGAASGRTIAGAPGSLQGIAQCESGGNPQAIGGGGRYRGKYQFSVETWRSVGGSGDPAAAPEAEQDRRAAMLYSRSGTASWPNCG